MVIYDQMLTLYPRLTVNLSSEVHKCNPPEGETSSRLAAEWGSAVDTQFQGLEKSCRHSKNNRPKTEIGVTYTCVAFLKRNHHLRMCFVDLREKGREGGRGEERRKERLTRGTATWTCDLTRSRTCGLLMYRMMPLPTEPPGQG